MHVGQEDIKLKSTLHCKENGKKEEARTVRKGQASWTKVVREPLGRDAQYWNKLRG